MQIGFPSATGMITANENVEQPIVMGNGTEFSLSDYFVNGVAVSSIEAVSEYHCYIHGKRLFKINATASCGGLSCLFDGLKLEEFDPLETVQLNEVLYILEIVVIAVSV